QALENLSLLARVESAPDFKPRSGHPNTLNGGDLQQVKRAKVLSSKAAFGAARMRDWTYVQVRDALTMADKNYAEEQTAKAEAEKQQRFDLKAALESWAADDMSWAVEMGRLAT